ncbi:MAG TPA: hypothetical protein VGM84_28230 [Steroidobacteraceae bacterium]
MGRIEASARPGAGKSVVFAGGVGGTIDLTFSTGCAQQALQFGHIQPVATDYRAIQEQDRDIQAVSTLKNGVRVDIDDLDRRKRHPRRQLLEFRDHLIAQVALVAMNDRQS